MLASRTGGWKNDFEIAQKKDGFVGGTLSN